jgi:hypothetical protein
MERPDAKPVREVVGRDIFDVGLELPEHVCIAAPGLNGVGNYHKIGDTFTIGVNYGVSLPIHLDLWLHGDWWGIGKDWFERCDTGYWGRRAFVLGLAERCRTWGDDDLTFTLVSRDEPTPGFHLEHKKKFRPDETSVGIAIDLACRFGAREIDLIGVDMKDDLYWDGMVSTCNHCDRSDGVWPFAEMLMDVVRFYEGQGVRFRSLSKTALEVATA